MGLSEALDSKPAEKKIALLPSRGFLDEVEKVATDKENQLEPSKWNRPEVIMPAEEFVVPPLPDAAAPRFQCM
jgi:hypothetical protein